MIILPPPIIIINSNHLLTTYLSPHLQTRNLQIRNLPIYKSENRGSEKLNEMPMDNSQKKGKAEIHTRQFDPQACGGLNHYVILSHKAPENLLHLLSPTKFWICWQRKKCLKPNWAPLVSVLTAEINCSFSKHFLATLSNDPNCRLLPFHLGRAPWCRADRNGVGPELQRHTVRWQVCRLS